MNEWKKTQGLRRIVNALGYSRDGLQAAYRFEAAFRQVIYLNGFLLIWAMTGWGLSGGLSARMVLIMLSFVSVIVELLNSAIEAVVDDISLEKRPLAKRAKDMGSAAQLLTMTAQVVLWAMVLLG